MQFPISSLLGKIRRNEEIMLKTGGCSDKINTLNKQYTAPVPTISLGI